MAKTITDPSDVLNEVHGLLVIDLHEQSYALVDDRFNDIFLEPEVGLYLKGDVRAFLKANQFYYPASQLLQPDKHIQDFNEILSLKEDLVNDRGEVVLPYNHIVARKQLITTQPTLPVRQIEATYSIIADHLSKLCRYARMVKRVRLEDIIKPGYHYLIDNDEFEVAFESLIDSIYHFVGRDVWNIYFCRFKGSTLIIEKSCDWRIYDWHCIKHNEKMLRGELDLEEYESANNAILYDIKYGK